MQYFKRFNKRTFSAVSHANFYDKYAKNPTQIQGLSVNVNLKLSDVADTGKFEYLERATIANIWKEHYERKPFTSGLTINQDVYSLWIGKRANECRQFVIPLNVGNGICNFLVQHNKSPLSTMSASIAFTPLDQFQKYAEAAPVRMVSYCFGELLCTKQIGLTRTDFDGNLLSRTLADLLLKNCIDMYSIDENYQWVWNFNHQPDAFDYDAFLQFFKRNILPSRWDSL